MKTSSINKNVETNEFNECGYVILRNIIDRRHIDDTYYALVKLFGKYNIDCGPQLTKNLLDSEPWISPLFNSEMIKFRELHPELFGIMYDAMQTTVALQRLCACDGLIQSACSKIGEESTDLTMTGHMLRMDAPNDNRNALDWHQDISYYNQNISGENGFVVWIPMHQVLPENGTIKVLPESHKGGRIFVSSEGSNNFVSEQFRVPDEYVAKFTEIDVLADAGDAVIFNMNLVHRSGSNTSNTVRFAAGIRLHKCLKEDFLAGRLLYKSNERIGRMCDYLKKVN